MHPITLIAAALVILVVSLVLSRGTKRDEERVALPVLLLGIVIRLLLFLVALLLLQLGGIALLLGG